MEKQLLDEIRTIKLMCITNFIELQEIRRKLGMTERTGDDWHEYANHTAEQVSVLSKKMHRLLKDDLPNLWENAVGK